MRKASKKAETKPAKEEQKKGVAENSGADKKPAGNLLQKLPILGPAMWLYARDPMRKFMFVGDIEGAVVPPVVLDQCRLYSRDGVPVAFFSWAKVSDAVDARIRSGHLKIAPHEWNSGDHLWMVDMVSPFGNLDKLFADLRKQQLSGEKISALVPDPKNKGQLRIQEWDSE